MLVVADASPLRYLIVLGLEQLLPTLFGEIFTSPVVIGELSNVSTPAIVRAAVATPPEWLRIAKPTDDALARIAETLDTGERDALALAYELRAELVLIDEELGRQEAKALRIRTTGTIGVLRLAAERGLIDVPNTVALLRTSGFYMSESLIQTAFGTWL